MNTRLVVLLVALALVSPASAQVKVRAGEKKALPTEVNVDENREEPWAIVCEEGCKLLDYPDADRKVVPYQENGVEKRMPFGTVLLWAAKTEADDTNYYLLVRKEAKPDSRKIEQYIGWVDERLLIKADLKTERSALEAMKDANGLHRKAVIVTRYQQFKPVAGKDSREEPDKATLSRVTAAPIYFGPSTEARAATPISLLRLLFIWGDTRPLDRKEGFVLVGETAGIGSVTDTKTILGWIPKARISEWNTREAFEFDIETAQGTKPRKQPAEVFNDARTAHDAMNGEKRDAIFRETLPKPGELALPMHPDLLRFFFLRWPEQTTEEKDIKKKYEFYEHPVTKDSISLKHVGVYAGFVSSETGTTEIQSDELEKLKRKLDQLREEFTNVEILFVIDDTSSMIPHFEGVASVFDEVLDDLSRDTKRNVKLGLAYYNDVLKAGVNPSTTVRVESLKPFKGAEGAAIVSRFRKHRPGNGGADCREQVLRGLREGIRKAGFTDYARKVVVLMGDMGNNPAWDTDEFPTPTLDEIDKELNPVGRSPVELHTIQFVDPDGRFETTEEKKAAGEFRDQMKEILARSRKTLEARNLTAGKYGRSAGGDYLLKDKGRLREVLLARFKAIEEERKIIDQQLMELSLGRFTVEIGPELETLLKGEGIDLQKLRKLKGAQVFETGYIFEKNADGVRQVSERILVSAGNIDDMIKVLERLEERDPSRRNVQETLLQAVKTQAGEMDTEKLKGMSFQEAFSKTLRGLTFTSPLLRDKIGTVKKGQVSENQRALLLKKRMMLEDIRKEVRYTYKNEPRNVAGVIIDEWKRVGDPVKLDSKTPQTMRRHTFLGRDRTAMWYWIDRENEWP